MDIEQQRYIDFNSDNLPVNAQRGDSSGTGHQFTGSQQTDYAFEPMQTATISSRSDYLLRDGTNDSGSHSAPEEPRLQVDTSGNQGQCYFPLGFE